MERLIRTALLTVIVSVVWIGGATRSAMAADPFTCAGLSSIPSGATLAADRTGRAILVTSTGLVIHCDSTGVFSEANPAGFGVVTRAGSATASSVAAPFDPPAGWTLVAVSMMPGAGPVVGYLGADANFTIVFWRSAADGPVETWMFAP